MDLDVSTSAPEGVELHESLAELYDYWNRARGDRWAPAWSDFRLTDFSDKLIPLLIVLDVKRDPMDFVYRFWGTANTVNLGYDCTGKSVHENGLFGGKVFNECRQVVEERRPIIFHSKVTRDDGLYREYSRIRLPLSDGGDEVAHIISSVRITVNLVEDFGE